MIRLLLETLVTIITLSPHPRMKWLLYPGACVEFLKDDALQKALLNALESEDYRDVLIDRCPFSR